MTLQKSFLISLLIHGMMLWILSLYKPPKIQPKVEYIEIELIKPQIPIKEVEFLPKKIVKVKKGSGFKEIRPKFPYTQLPEFKTPQFGLSEQIKKTQERPQVLVDKESDTGYPADVATETYGMQEAVSKKTAGSEYAPFTLIGPISERGILYQPIPKLPEEFEERGIEPGDIKLKIFVLPQGNVSEVLIMKSSGWGNWDSLVARTTKKWIFSKLPPNIHRIDWGYVTVKATLR